MYISLVTPWLKTGAHNLERRKGGGGGGGGGEGGGGGGGGEGGGEGGGGGGGGSGSSEGGGSNSKNGGPSDTNGDSTSISVKSASGSTLTAQSYGSGSTKVVTIPSGQLFSGRLSGGGTRSNIFGSRQYGSGYPGLSTPSIAGRGFPFGFWPITYGSAVSIGANGRFHSQEYGDPTNSSRPGGVLVDAPFQPPGGSNTYHVLSDNATVQELIVSITANCSLSTTLISAVPYNTSDPTQPKPEQVIQYYRSSSIALTLDGYNDSAVFSADDNAPDTPLPSNLNATFLDCLNQTIGAAAPLLTDAARPRAQISGLLALMLITLHLLRCCSL